MIVYDFETGFDVANLPDLEAVLRRRHGDGINSFWIGETPGGFPALNIVVKGDLAHVHYFPGGDHPGFASVGWVPGFDPSKTTTFI